MYHIPETMPQDWLAPALDSIGVSVSDDKAGAIEAHMRKAYVDLLTKTNIPTMNARLKMACFATAQLHKDGT